MDRFDYIKKQRKWYEASSSFCLIQEGESNRIDFLFNKFIELILDTAIVLNPMEIELFHERKKLYYNKERGFEESNDFISSMEILNILNKKNALLEELYTYTFEEIPQIIGLTKKQLNYKKGDPESIEEVREKMNFLKKRFDNLPKIEQGIRQLLKKYIN